MTEDYAPPEIEALAKSMAESAPGAPDGAWFRMSAFMRKRWRHRAMLGAMEYENALAVMRKK